MTKMAAKLKGLELWIDILQLKNAPPDPDTIQTLETSKPN